MLSESSGYVLYDYPGLTSPTSLRALKAMKPGERGIINLIQALQPEWMVLRIGEYEGLKFMHAEIASRYELMAEFISDADLTRSGTTLNNIDKYFVVLRRIGGD